MILFVASTLTPHYVAIVLRYINVFSFNVTILLRFIRVCRVVDDVALVLKPHSTWHIQAAIEKQWVNMPIDDAISLHSDTIVCSVVMRCHT